MTSQPNNTKSRTQKFLGVVGVITAIVTLIELGPKIRDFFLWSKSAVTEVEFKAAFPNEKWTEAEKADYDWLVGEWDIPKLRGFISEYKIENSVLYQKNKGRDHVTPNGTFDTEWIPAKYIYKSDEGQIAVGFAKESQWPISFLRKTDECSCYQGERYRGDDGSVKEGKGRQMLKIGHIEHSADGLTYHCK